MSNSKSLIWTPDAVKARHENQIWLPAHSQPPTLSRRSLLLGSASALATAMPMAVLAADPEPFIILIDDEGNAYPGYNPGSLRFDWSRYTRTVASALWTFYPYLVQRFRRRYPEFDIHGVIRDTIHTGGSVAIFRNLVEKLGQGKTFNLSGFLGAFAAQLGYWIMLFLGQELIQLELRRKGMGEQNAKYSAAALAYAITGVWTWFAVKPLFDNITAQQYHKTELRRRRLWLSQNSLNYLQVEAVLNSVYVWGSGNSAFTASIYVPKKTPNMTNEVYKALPVISEDKYVVADFSDDLAEINIGFYKPAVAQMEVKTNGVSKRYTQLVDPSRWADVKIIK